MGKQPIRLDCNRQSAFIGIRPEGQEATFRFRSTHLTQPAAHGSSVIQSRALYTRLTRGKKLPGECSTPQAQDRHSQLQTADGKSRLFLRRRMIFQSLLQRPNSWNYSASEDLWPRAGGSQWFMLPPQVLAAALGRHRREWKRNGI